LNIWAWVYEETRTLRESGNERLADLMDEIPDAVSNDRHLEAEGMVHEGVALAKALKRAWVELYLRHWDLQSRVLHRNHGRAALHDAIDLVDFAHRSETKGCPQAICTIQDLSSCYGRADGVGYFEARRQVVEDTLKQIETTRACFTCLGGQLIEAFTDAERPAEALEAWARLEARRTSEGSLDQQEPFEKIEALIALGQAQDALDELTRILPFDRDNDHVRLLRRVQKARILARLDRTEEAKDSLPAFAEIVATGALHWSWVDAVKALSARDPAINDAERGAQVQRLVVERESLGAFYEAITLGEMQAELALGRGAPVVAELALAGIERRIAHLHGRAHGEKIAARVRERILAGAAEPRDPQTIEVLLGKVDEDMTRAGLLEELGFHAEAVALAQAVFDREGPSHATNLGLGHILRQERDPAALEAFLAELDHRGPWRIDVAFLRGLRARTDGDAVRALACFEEVLTLDPKVRNTRAFASEILLLDGHFAGALAHLDVLASGTEPPSVTHWDRMTAAAALGDWPRVVESAKALGIDLPDTPPTDDGPLCRVERRVNGKPERLYARATSPVTARVVSSVAGGRVVFGDRIVFRPVPLDPDRTGEPPLWCYREIHLVSEAGRVLWELDGAHPGDAAVEALGRALAERDIELRVQSADEYKVGEGVPGLFAWLLAPASTPLEEIRAMVGPELALAVPG